MGEQTVHRSTLATHPDVAGVLPRFVGRLAARVAELRELQAREDMAELTRAVHQLRGSGKSFGFAGMSELAGSAEELLVAGKSWEEVGAALRLLVAYMECVEGYG